MTRALQKLVHVACRDLGLDAEARRDLQLAVTGKASMADMSEADLTKLIDRLKADGFKLSPKPRSAAPRPDLRLIHVLWSKLGQKGVLDRPDRAGLNAFIRSRFEASWSSVPRRCRHAARPQTDRRGGAGPEGLGQAGRDRL